MKQLRTNSRDETVRIGYELGKLLNKGDIIALTGDLGAGKTTFTNGIAAGLGIKGYITSPTFTIINEYDGKIPLYHFDAYRIANPDEMYDVGFDEYLEGSGVVVVEWADVVKSLLPPEYIEVNMKKDPKNGEETRIITIDFKGEKYLKLEKCFPID